MEANCNMEITLKSDVLSLTATTDEEVEFLIQLANLMRQKSRMFPPSKAVLDIAALFHQGKSLSQMAAVILKNEASKTSMFRLLNKTKLEYPELFLTVNTIKKSGTAKKMENTIH